MHSLHFCNYVKMHLKEYVCYIASFRAGFQTRIHMLHEISGIVLYLCVCFWRKDPNQKDISYSLEGFVFHQRIKSCKAVENGVSALVQLVSLKENKYLIAVLMVSFPFCW